MCSFSSQKFTCLLTSVCFVFEVVNSVAYSRTKQRVRDAQISSYTEKKKTKQHSSVPGCHSIRSLGNFTPALCPPTSIEWNGSNCSTIRINIQAIMSAKGAANHIYVDCQIHYYKQMAVLALQCSWEKTDIISN